MKTGTKILIAVLAVIGIIAIWMVSANNKMVNGEEGVTAAWSQVENQYQRRADLIPNLVNTVKGYTEHEASTLEAVVAARAKATQITVDPENLTAEKLAAFQEAQGELQAALGKLLAISENYPDLKANENFIALQAELSGTENRISVERKRFNEATRHFNTMIRRFPNNLLANMFGFETKAYFEAEAGTEKAPEVKF